MNDFDSSSRTERIPSTFIIPFSISNTVGGAYASQHTLGEAADIRLPLTSYTAWDDNKRHTDLETARKWFDWLEHNTDFDQLIMETSNGKDYWIHVSCRKNRRANRHQVIRYLKK